MTAPATPVEQACVDALRAAVTTSMLSADDADYLDGNTYLRFARARDGDVDKAKKLLLEALAWRKSFQPYAIRGSDVARAMQELTMTCGGRCRAGRPVLVMTLAVPNACEVDERVKQLVYILEMTQRKGYDTITWVVDFGEMGKHERDPRSRMTRKETMHILQNYYPERLGLMLLYRLPWYANVLITLVKPFLDARTRAKIVKAGSTLADLQTYVDASQLPESLGGTLKTDGLTNLDALPVCATRDNKNSSSNSSNSHVGATTTQPVGVSVFDQDD